MKMIVGPNILDKMPEKLKNLENLEHFKKEIKTWNLIIAHVGCVRII